MNILVCSLTFALASFGCFAQSLRAGDTRDGVSHLASARPPAGKIAAAAPDAAAMLSAHDLRTLLSSESMNEKDTDRLYIVRINPLEFKKVAWLPYKRASYTVNVPPGGRLIHLRSAVRPSETGVSVHGLANDGNDWLHVTALVRDGRVELQSASAAHRLVTLLNADDARALTSVLR